MKVFVPSFRLFSFCLLFLGYKALGQKSGPNDYLGLKQPILFEKVSYTLAWTAHPNDGYYKQEYLGPADQLEKFKRLITIDVLEGATQPEEAVAKKIAELEVIKKNNPVVQYNKYEREGEIMLDFLIGQSTKDGKKMTVVERNVYRYKSVTDANGKPALLLFAVSDRAYGDDIERYFKDLQQHSEDLLQSVGMYELPAIRILR